MVLWPSLPVLESLKVMPPKPPKKRSRRNFLGRRHKQSTASRQRRVPADNQVILENIGVDEDAGGGETALVAANQGVVLEIIDANVGVMVGGVNDADATVNNIEAITDPISSQQSTRFRNDDNWRTSRAVSSAKRQQAKTEAKMTDLKDKCRKKLATKSAETKELKASNIALKRQVSELRAAAKEATKLNYLDRKMARTNAINKEKVHQHDMELLQQLHDKEISKAHTEVV